MTVPPQVLSATDLASFERDGYLVKRGFYEASEVAVLRRTAAEDESIQRRAYGIDDGQGGATEIALWNEPGEDSFGAVARGQRLVDAVSSLLGGEVYHYHSKITMKRPGAGGTWVWHQDYGYWYQNGCLYPDMLTVAVPLDPMTNENGCLQLMSGSHRLGRIDHGFVGAQTGADPERVRAAGEQLPTVPFVAEPGDVMFFHCNTLHTSSPNRSARDRNLLLVAFNTRANDPVRDHHHPRYRPVELLGDDQILARAERREGEARRFLDPSTDRSIATFEALG